MPYYPQPLTVKKAGTAVGTEPAVNFIEGSGVTITVTDDPTNNEVDVEIAASGGSPAGSDTQIQYNNSGALGASAALTWDNATFTMSLGGFDGEFPALAKIQTLGADLQFLGRNTSGEDASGVGFRGGDTDDSTGGGAIFRGGYSDTGIGGAISLLAGDTDTGTPGSVTIQAGEVDTEGPGGSVTITATDGLADSNPDQNGGSITLTVGAATGSGAPGQLIVVNLPTSDPSVSGALWIDTGAGRVLKVSA